MRLKSKNQKVSLRGAAVVQTVAILGFAYILGCGDGAIAPEADLTLAERLQATLDAQRTSLDLIGLSAAVIMPDGTTWLGVSGMSDPSRSEAISSDMVFGIGSITKNFTAALVLELVEDNSLSLDDSLHSLLPSFDNIDSTITVRQLLNHTSGVFNFTDDPTLWNELSQNPSQAWTPEEMLARVKAPIFPPGERWSYSNTNYTLLGILAKEATGSDLSTAFRERFLDPLNLTATYLQSEEQHSRHFADNWSDIDGDGALDNISSVAKTGLYSAAWASGGIVSTSEDVALWGRALLSGEVLSSASLDEMTTFVEIAESPLTGYGLGVFRINTLGKEMWGHGGDVPGYSSFLLMSPEDQASVAVLTNQDFQGSIMPVTIALLLTLLDLR